MNYCDEILDSFTFDTSLFDCPIASDLRVPAVPISSRDNKLREYLVKATKHAQTMFDLIYKSERVVPKPCVDFGLCGTLFAYVDKHMSIGNTLLYIETVKEGKTLRFINTILYLFTRNMQEELTFESFKKRTLNEFLDEIYKARVSFN